MTSSSDKRDDLRARLERTVGLSNDVLSDLEQNMARLLLLEAQAQTGSNNDGTVERIDRLRVALAPHKHLPPELLGEIFVTCMGSAEISIPLNRSPNIPWIFGRICSRWRKVAQAEPRLWNRIAINEDPFRTGYWEIFQYLISLIGNLPIDIRVKNVPERRTVMFDILDDYSHRVRSLTFLVHLPITRQFTTISYSFNALESAKILIRHDRGDVEHISFVTKLSTSENLRVLEIEADHAMVLDIPLDAIGFNSNVLPSSGLTHLTLSLDMTTSASWLINIFLHCTQLIHCDVRIDSGSHGSQVPSSSVVTLKSLRTLKFRVSVPSKLGQIISLLIFPELRSVGFYFNGLGRSMNRDWPEEQILDFLSRSASIESFTGSCLVSELCYMQIIRSMPHITTFTILTNDVISNYTLDTMREENLLPNLETFAVRVRSLVAISILLKSRLPSTLAPPRTYKGISKIIIYITHKDSLDENFGALSASLLAAGRVYELHLLR